jgi:hypothetical protein
MMRILDGKNQWRRILDMEHSQIYEPDNAWVALTDGRYKYIYFTLTGEEQLFDLQNDPYELNNILSSGCDDQLHAYWYAKLVDNLRVRGNDWVQGDKLLVQQKSVLRGENFPVK